MSVRKMTAEGWVYALVVSAGNTIADGSGTGVSVYGGFLTYLLSAKRRATALHAQAQLTGLHATRRGYALGAAQRTTLLTAKHRLTHLTTGGK